MTAQHNSAVPHTSNSFIEANVPLTCERELRKRFREAYQISEQETVAGLLDKQSLSDAELRQIEDMASGLVVQIRDHNKPTMMESFLSEYGLSTPEGVGLMCLAEALLRVPDANTIDELIKDKIESSDWSVHLGQSSSPLVNASTWALMITGRILDEPEDPTQSLSALIKRVGEPFVRRAVSKAMKLLGKQFVLGEDIQRALKEARLLEQQGYTYSYDMLGEAAHTFDDAKRYFLAYEKAIEALSIHPEALLQRKPGISIKLSALHPRYEYRQKEKVLNELVPAVLQLANKAAQANIGFNIDAEEADRLDLSLDVIEALLQAPSLRHWKGLGIVIQAYNRRARLVIEWLIAAAKMHDRHIMVRLVKGAYWDSEIKQAQELGLASYPVFTRKVNTDVNYLSCAELLLANRDRVYPQFATHNAHSVCAILHMAGEDTHSYEFQRLHGMGEALHETLRKEYGTQCRIYAPVGAHQDLLAYLVRRLLENGANSSFVNQIVDTSQSPDYVARCPVKQIRKNTNYTSSRIVQPIDLYKPQRPNSRGYQTNEPASIQGLLEARETYRTFQWQAYSLIAGKSPTTPDTPLYSPNDASDLVGYFAEATSGDIDDALAQALNERAAWALTPVKDRALALERAAEQFEQQIPELCALLCREAGKTLEDAISEVREAVDFLRYYAVEAKGLSPHSEVDSTTQSLHKKSGGHGLIVCISPWNFPLAIFTGQISGALVSGNTVIAKPAEQTPLISMLAVKILHDSGIPVSALQLLIGSGETVGRKLCHHPAIDGVCFTGSTETAKQIEVALCSRNTTGKAFSGNANPLLLAETGGLNAMIVDSTALTEQVVRDTLISAFQSAGQRCSALRILYVQEEARDRLETMLKGAMDTLTLGDTWYTTTDVGPVIDTAAWQTITKYLEEQRAKGTVLHQCAGQSKAQQSSSLFIPPTLIAVNGIDELSREIFGPVLHIASYKASELDTVIEAINKRGYGLTLGVHSRIDDRVQKITASARIGNIYVNRNQIGAVVGSQPFGGEGLSGTGPKAGGPWYVPRLSNIDLDADQIFTANTPPLMTRVLPGPTGESNVWKAVSRSCVLLIPGHDSQTLGEVKHLESLGCKVIVADQSQMDDLPNSIESFGISAVVARNEGPQEVLAIRKQLAEHDGPIIPIVTDLASWNRLFTERHICIDTTAAGGNASLLAQVDET